MKKATGLFLILVFVTYLAGVEAYYSLKLKISKETISALITHKNIQVAKTASFSFSPTQYQNINWQERNKEFIYNGRHYDIISLNFYSDEISMVCFDDSNETSIANALTGFMEHMFSQAPASNNSNNDIANKICKEYLPNTSVPQNFFFHVITTIETHRVLVNRYAPIAAIWHPPSLA